MNDTINLRDTIAPKSDQLNADDLIAGNITVKIMGVRRGSRDQPVIIDIDGVISDDIPNEESERMKTAGEIPGAKEYVNDLYDKGHIVSFFTSRTEEENGDITRKWLKEHNFKYHSLILGKPRGGNYHYIDNSQIRATTFTGKFGDFVSKKLNVEVFE